MPIRCEIISQDRLVFEGEVDVVVVPGSQGEMAIRPKHAPLLSILELGLVRIRCQGEEDIFTVTGGIIEVLPGIVTILADASEHISEIDVSRAREARERAKEFLEKGPPPDTDTYLKMEAALRRSNLRLELVEQYRRRGRRSRPPGMGSSSSSE